MCLGTGRTLNMGAWSFVQTRVNLPFELVSRKASASPATGFSKIHKKNRQI